MEKYDIIVIGGGPSGAIFSYFIDKKYKTLLLEKRNYNDENNFHIKSCGGLLSENAQASLASLNYSIPNSILANPQVFNVKVIDFDNNITKKYYKGYINIDREKFDDFLLKKVKNHVEVIRGAVYNQFERINKKVYRIKYRIDGVLKYAETNMIIGADGANSRVAHEIVPVMANNYVSIQKKYKKIVDIPEYYAIFDKKVNDYYSWIIPKDDEIILGSILNKNDNAHDKFDILENKIRERENILGDFIKEEGTIIKRPGFNSQFVGHANIGLIGEAAGFISPSSSEGISYAIKSGYYLAQSINKYGIEHGMKYYKKKCNSIMYELKLKYLKSKLIYNPFTRNIIIRSGIFANKLNI
ncbi:MAG: FAD-binding protein [Fusobacteriaceae bacterium]|jgi:flavin-dependent dehydrogenase|nr:FAD-binding protein [Fusobacteriaceae bacterium]